MHEVMAGREPHIGFLSYLLLLLEVDVPELPEVETIRRALEPVLLGKVVASVQTFTATLRSPLNEQSLNSELVGKRVVALKRRAKYLLFVFSDSKYLLSHLGMTGSYRVEQSDFSRLKHDRAALTFTDGEVLVYNDIRKFGELKLVEVGPSRDFPDKFDRYAPEPLSRGFSGKYLYTALRRISAPIKTAIMRQELVVGVGNIYANEALFAAGISPLRPASSLSEDECTLLVREIKAVLRRSLNAGGTTISDYKHPDGSEGKFALNLKVYGRNSERCLRKGCSGTVCRIVQTGRATFYCSVCQH